MALTNFSAGMTMVKRNVDYYQAYRCLTCRLSHHRRHLLRRCHQSRLFRCFRLQTERPFPAAQWKVSADGFGGMKKRKTNFKRHASGLRVYKVHRDERYQTEPSVHGVQPPAHKILIYRCRRADIVLWNSHILISALTEILLGTRLALNSQFY